MIGKLALFAVAYVLGARAGRARFDQLVSMTRWVARREEVQTAMGLAQGALQAAIERTQDRGPGEVRERPRRVA
jgi:hypothetical protein